MGVRKKMKKVKYFLIVLLSIFLTGCITTKKVEKARVDQKISGNMGYVEGKVTEAKKSEGVNKKEKRKYFKVNVELPPFPELRERYWKDDKIWGNRGYIMGGPK